MVSLHLRAINATLDTLLNIIYNVLRFLFLAFTFLFLPLFASLCIVLLTIKFLVMYFLSLPEFVNFYLEQQKRKERRKERQIGKRQETESKEHIVDELLEHACFLPRIKIPGK